MNELKDRLKAVMEYYSLEIKDIAEMADISRQAIEFILKGETKSPKASSLVNIAKGLPSLSLEWLTTGQGEMIKSYTSNANNSMLEANTEIITGNADLEKFLDSMNLPRNMVSDPQFRQAVLKLYLKQIEINSEKSRIDAIRKLFGL